MTNLLALKYEIVYGSHAYGTADEDSDLDLRGIFIPSVDEHLSLREIKEIRKTEGDTDYLYFPLRKFISLSLRNNPSVLEWLFVDPAQHRVMTKEATILIENRHLLLSKEIYPRFKGYAHSEFHVLTKLTGETGAKRKKLILEHGYSPKNAMNCIRLLQQGIEMLQTGNLVLPRPNAAELVAIKRGEKTYQDIVRMFDKLLDEIDEACQKSGLPENTDRDYWDRLQIDLIKMQG